MATQLITFNSPRFVNKVVLADLEFGEFLEKIDQFAAANNLEIFITDSARQQGVPVNGAIVPPASRSNHLVGHAIDMNLRLNGQLFNSVALRNFNNLPQAIKNFLTSIRNDPVLRWGGDFNDLDPVHIDDGINLRNPRLWEEKFFIIQRELIELTNPGTIAGQPRLLFLTRPYMQGTDVQAVQEALRDKFGFTDLSTDGRFGPETDAAVTVFQRSQGLDPDGRVGRKTREKLGI